MALVMPLTLPATTVLQDGVVVEVPETTYEQSYARVMFVRAASDQTGICVCWYADESERLAGKQPVKVQEFLVATAALSGDVYPAAYAHLKTLLDFDGAISHPVTDPPDIARPVKPTPEEQAATLAAVAEQFWSAGTITQPEAQA